MWAQQLECPLSFGQRCPQDPETNVIATSSSAQATDPVKPPGTAHPHSRGSKASNHIKNEWALFWRRMPFRTTRRTCSCTSTSMPHAWHEHHASTSYPLTPPTGSMRLYDHKGRPGPLKPLWAPFAWYFVRTATWDAGFSEPAKPRPHQRRLRTSTEKHTAHFPDIAMSRGGDRCASTGSISQLPHR